MLAYLVIREGSKWTDVFRLVAGRTITIGRAPTNQIIIKDERCSRHHAEIFLSKDHWVLRDLESRNATLVGQEKVEGDWDDIPKPGINYKTSVNMKMDIRRQKKAVGGYYASVAYMDAQVGKVLDALEEAGIEDRTIVIFTSDHGYHLGEHDFWAKVSLLDESS